MVSMSNVVIQTNHLMCAKCTQNHIADRACHANESAINRFLSLLFVTRGLYQYKQCYFPALGIFMMIFVAI